MYGRDIFVCRTFENMILYLDLKTEEIAKDNTEVMAVEKRDLYAVSEILEKNGKDANKVKEFQEHFVPFVESVEKAFDELKSLEDEDFKCVNNRQQEFFKFIERNINSKIDSKLLDGKNL